MEQIIYREMKLDEQQTVCNLVRHVFNEFLAPAYEKVGIEEFFRFANPSAMETRIKAGGFVLVATKSDKVVGMLEFTPPNHIAMLFVSLRRQGIAKKLLLHTVARIHAANLAVSKITVNSSPYAEPIYRKLGFYQVGDMTTDHGITYIPIEREI